MSAVKSVLLAISVATGKRDQMEQRWGQAQRAYLFAQDQMQQLENYAAETESKWTLAAQIRATPELMRHHYQFMDRLHHAIGLQKGVLGGLFDQVESARKSLLEAEFRLTSLKQVLKKKQADIAVLQVRREQKQMDEFAALQYAKTKTRYHSGELS